MIKTKATITNIDSLARDIAKENELIDKSIRVLDSFNSKSSYELWDELLEQNLSEFDSMFLSSEYQNVILFNDLKSVDEYPRVGKLDEGNLFPESKKWIFGNLLTYTIRRKNRMDTLTGLSFFNVVSTHNNNLSVKPYRYLIADEVQDLSNVELRFLRSLVEAKENDLFLVGDPFQKIYARKINFTAAGISVRGDRSKQLQINYRTSEEIKRLALSAVKGINYDDFDGEAGRT